MAKFIRGNNKGEGFYYVMADGHRGWVHGLSRQEWDAMARKHGGFLRYDRA